MESSTYHHGGPFRLSGDHSDDDTLEDDFVDDEEEVFENEWEDSDDSDEETEYEDSDDHWSL